jgi:rhodanese-related sulfurtransferase
MRQIPSTRPTALKETLEAGEQVTVVDVRQPHEFERGHIEAPNTVTVNVPLRQLQAVDPSNLLEDVPTENVVTVCASGNRSSMATQLLNRAGIDAKNLQYGMQGWQQVAT